MAKRRKRKISFGCLFWGVFIVLIAVLFFLNKDTISFVLDKTNAKDIFFKNKTEKTAETSRTIPEIQSKEDNTDSTQGTGDGSKELEREIMIVDSSQQAADKKSGVPEKSESSYMRNNIRKTSPNTDTQVQQGSMQVAVPNSPPSHVADEPVSQRTVVTQQSPSVSSTTQKPHAVSQEKSETGKSQTVAVRKAVIYWVRVDADGKLSPKRAARLLPKSDAPMSDALEALFAAPTVDELKQGVRTLIPPDTKLRSAWVKDSVAFINVSEEFQFNQYGIDGALAQLLQVVFTATEFPTVKSVQFLIEGQKKDYLGAEGVWIGSPLSRFSF